MVGAERRMLISQYFDVNVLAAVLHNASSVAVVANSSRLIRYRLDRSAVTHPAGV